MPEPVLRTEKLTKRFGDLTAVSNLTLEVNQGEVFGFLGPNGAGKTTAINMICGLLKPDGGYVFLHGEPVAGSAATIRSGAAAMRSRVGICPQEIILWDKLTCIEQLQYIGRLYGLSKAVARQRSDALLNQLDLTEKANKQAHTLSGGMKRRLNLALALVHDPQIVVLDEPEAGLDPQSRLKVREYIQSLARIKTVILTTHNMDEADRLADRVAIIDHGELLALDTPEALKSRLGAGDILEVRLGGQVGDVDALRSQFARIEGISVLGILHDTLTLQALDLVNLLPRILKTLTNLGIQSGEVRLRQNTLEDVFIQLTGRRLRE